MRRIVVTISIILAAGATLTLASDKPDVSEFLGGLKKNAAGCFCCVKQTCVVTKNEADCKKIGGVKVTKCGECEKAKKK